MGTGCTSVGCTRTIINDMMSPRNLLASLIRFKESLRIGQQILSFFVDESAFRLGKVGFVYVETDERHRKTVSSQGRRAEAEERVHCEPGPGYAVEPHAHLGELDWKC